LASLLTISVGLIIFFTLLGNARPEKLHLSLRSLLILITALCVLLGLLVLAIK
jgi:hypothetical protein